MVYRGFTYPRPAKDRFERLLGSSFDASGAGRGEGISVEALS